MNMLNSLDLLVIVFMGLIAMTLLSLCLMFLLKNKTAKRVCFYTVSALSLYVTTIGLRIGIGGLFPTQIAVGALTGLLAIAAIVLELRGKGDEKKLRIARILAAATLVLGMINAIF